MRPRGNRRLKAFRKEILRTEKGSTGICIFNFRSRENKCTQIHRFKYIHIKSHRVCGKTHFNATTGEENELQLERARFAYKLDSN